MSATASPLATAPTRAAVMAQAREENFPVASLLLGQRRRTHLLAVYGFARLVDDAGDEAVGDRSALLDWLEGDLERIYAGELPEHPVMRALTPTVRALHLPAEPFRRLIEAGRRDQVIDRYPSFEALLDYCSYSAAPVGEIVLHVFGAATPDRISLSDRICAGLQVTEHLQDVAEDRARGRAYLPEDDMARFGCTDLDLQARAPSRRFLELMAFEATRARALLADGAPLIRRLPLRPGFAVAGFLAGGRAALDALAAGGFDVLGARPRPTRGRIAAALIQTLWESR